MGELHFERCAIRNYLHSNSSKNFGSFGTIVAASSVLFLILGKPFAIADTITSSLAIEFEWLLQCPSKIAIAIKTIATIILFEAESMFLLSSLAVNRFSCVSQSQYYFFIHFVRDLLYLPVDLRALGSFAWNTPAPGKCSRSK